MLKVSRPLPSAQGGVKCGQHIACIQRSGPSRVNFWSVGRASMSLDVIPKQKRRPKAPFQGPVRSNLAEDLKIRRRRAATLARKAEVQLLAIAQTGKA